MGAAGCVPVGPVPDGPVADARLTPREIDAGIRGTASVVLDATASRPSGAAVLTYEWVQASEVVARGAQAEINLPLGEHHITLVVTDDQGRSDSVAVTITITGAPRTEYFMTIDVSGRGETVPAQGTTTWPAGGTVELRAVPAPGFQFVRWSGDLVGEVSATSIVMSEDRLITAEFRAIGTGALQRFFLPLPAGQDRTISQGNLGALSHQGLYAWDFPMPIGTPVVACGAGRVVKVVEDSPRNEPDSSIRVNHANVVKIDHGGGFVSLYAHLDHQGVVVEEGQYVVRGQVIGFSCDTGQSTGPHLHYEVTDALGTSIPTGFWEDFEDDHVPGEGDTVVSRNELSVESIFGYAPSTLRPDSFLVNDIELTPPTAPAFFYLADAEYLMAGRVLDDAEYVCVALVDPQTFETVFCDPTPANVDGTFALTFKFPPERVGRHYFGVISGKGGAEGITPLSIIIEPPPGNKPAPVAIVEQPEDAHVDFGDSGRLVGAGSVSHGGGALSYQWVQVSGPPASIADPTAADTDFTVEFGQGIARVAFQLTVFDGQKYSMPAQVEYVMPDTFFVNRMNVADFVCDSPDTCPNEDPPVISVATSVLSGWVEIVNARKGDELSFIIVNPSAQVVRRAELTINDEPGTISFWRFAWPTSDLDLTPGLWAAHFQRNGSYESSVAFRMGS